MSNNSCSPTRLPPPASSPFNETSVPQQTGVSGGHQPVEGFILTSTASATVLPPQGRPHVGRSRHDFERAGVRFQRAGCLVRGLQRSQQGG